MCKRGAYEETLLHDTCIPEVKRLGHYTINIYLDYTTKKFTID
jgi:hypothetical protein